MHELLPSAGLTAILMYGKPTQTIRDGIARFFPFLPKCALCLGFWVGVPIGLYLKDPFFPFSASAFSWGFDAAVNAMREVYLEKSDSIPKFPRF